MKPHVPPQVGIKAVREARGLTLEQLAAAIAEQGVPVTKFQLSNVENGTKRASERLLDAWSRALGVNRLHVRQEQELRNMLAAHDADRGAVAVVEVAA